MGGQFSLELGGQFDRFFHAAVKLVAYDYEFSSRQYFLRGEFFANADAELIQRLQDIHGEKWGEFYDYYADVKAFLSKNTRQKENFIPSYKPVNSEVHKFINRLKR